jgi:hypothetical protein
MSRAIASIAFVLGVVTFATNSLAADPDIDIVVAPKVLNLDSKGTVVTVHTDIAFSAVIGATVELNGIPIKYWKSDNRGNFVAKFALDEVKALVNNLVNKDRETVTLELTGDRYEKEGDDTVTIRPFTGSDEVPVIGVD